MGKDMVLKYSLDLKVQSQTQGLALHRSGTPRSKKYLLKDVRFCGHKVMKAC